jgi:hypothetical protein
MPTPIRKIQRLAASLAGHGPRSAADESWLGRALQTYLDGADLAASLGVAIEPGDRDPRRVAAQARRDELLRELAGDLCPEKPVTRQADYLASVIDRYFTTAWIHDRARTTPPERHAALWELLRLHPSPLGSRRIRMILGGK